jgi:hypothetical protein
VDAGPAGIVVSTVACPIQLAFRDLKVHAKRPLDLAKGKMTPGPSALWKPDVGSRQQSLSFDLLDLDTFPYNADGDPETPEDQIRLVARVGGHADYDFGLEFHWPEFWEGDFLPSVSAGYGVDLAGEAQVSIDGVARRSWYWNNGGQPLATIDFEPFVVWILVFFPKAEIVADVHGGASGRYAMDMSAEAHFKVGAGYSTDSGGFAQPPDLGASFSGLQVTSTENATALARVGPRLSLMLYDIVGPHGTLWFTSSLDANTERTPCWSLRGGAAAEVGIGVRLFGQSLVDWSTGFDITDKEYLSGACLMTAEQAKATDLVAPTFVPWSKRLAGVAKSSSLDRGFANISTTVDDDYLLSGDGAASLSRVTRDGKVRFARSYQRTGAQFPGPMRVSQARSTKDLGIVAAGFTPVNLLRLDREGRVLWSKLPQLPHQATEGITSIVENSDGTLVGVASVVLGDDGLQDVWIFKVAADGKPIWSKRWGRADRREWPVAVVPFGEDFMVVASTFGTTSSGVVLRLDRDGVLLWSREYGGATASITFRTGVRSMDGDIIVAGRTGIGGPKALLMKIKPDGAIGWSGFNKNSSLGIDATGLVQLSDGGYLVGGTWWSAGQDDHLWLARTDSIGEMVWFKKLAARGATNSLGLTLTGEGGALVTAFGAVSGSLAGDLLVLRVPVKTGAVAASGADLTVTDDVASFTSTEDAAGSTPSLGLVEFPVSWVDDPVKETALQPTVTEL